MTYKRIIQWRSWNLLVTTHAGSCL